jgi:hypothetical protein
MTRIGDPSHPMGGRRARRGGVQYDYWGFLQEAHQTDGPWILVSMTGRMTVLHAITASE